MDCSNVKVKPLSDDLMSERKLIEVGLVEEDNKSKHLLSSMNGGITKDMMRKRKVVQWNDCNGKDLAQILEYQPSDVSDSEIDDPVSCFCTATVIRSYLKYLQISR